jgi:hypothetical protein
VIHIKKSYALFPFIKEEGDGGSLNLELGYSRHCWSAMFLKKEKKEGKKLDLPDTIFSVALDLIRQISLYFCTNHSADFIMITHVISFP